MARPALSAARGIDIIDLLAAASRPMTLSDIARATGINVASCHAVLNVLAERGYLAREGRGFVLGPVLVAVGEAALAGQPLLARAEAAARGLVRELGLAALITGAVGEEIVGLVSIGAGGGQSPLLRTGERRALIPPIGAPFVAWSDETVIAEWLARSPDIDAEVLTALRRGVETIRERGFEVLLRPAETGGLASQLRALAAAEPGVVHLGPGMALPDRIAPEMLYDVTMIAAPLFDRRGACAYNLCLGPFPERLSGARILELADRLLRACVDIMHADRAR